MVYSLVSEFAHWFSHASESRSYPRKAKPFRLTWIAQDGKPQPGLGIEISPAGLVFASPVRPSKHELTLRARIREKDVAMRVTVQRETPIVQGGKPMFQVACKLTAIAADDWDLLMREVKDQAEPEARAATELRELRKKDDDSYRTLPLAVQRKIIELLVNGKRLEMPAEGTLPALRMQTLGRFQTADGRALQRVNIHSRRHLVELDSTMAYDTQLTIDDHGNVELLS